jgi:hypothetical protein
MRSFLGCHRLNLVKKYFKISDDVARVNYTKYRIKYQMVFSLQ